MQLDDIKALLGSQKLFNFPIQSVKKFMATPSPEFICRDRNVIRRSLKIATKIPRFPHLRAMWINLPTGRTPGVLIVKTVRRKPALCWLWICGPGLQWLMTSENFEKCLGKDQG